MSKLPAAGLSDKLEITEYSSIFGSQFSMQPPSSIEYGFSSNDFSSLMEGSSLLKYHSLFSGFSMPSEYAMSTSFPASSPGLVMLVSQSFSFFEPFDFFQSASFSYEFSVISSLSGMPSAGSFDMSSSLSYHFGVSLPFEYSKGDNLMITFS